MSLRSLICTICPPKVSEPELGQSQQEENRTCIITLHLRDFKSQTSLTLLLLPKITKTCQTVYTNHDRHKIKIEHDIIDKPVKLDILNEIPPQVNEIPAHFIHEIKTIAYDVSDVNLFPPTLMRFAPKKPT